MSTFEALVEKKGNLFVLCVFAAIGIMFLPVILPHIFHGSHIIHIGLHVAGLALAIFLTISTTYAYVKIRTKRLATAAIAFYIDTVSMLEISHLLIIGMLGIFSLGVFKRD